MNCPFFAHARKAVIALAAITAMAAPLAATPVAADTAASPTTSQVGAYVTGDGALYVTVVLNDVANAPVAGKAVALVITLQKSDKPDSSVTISGDNISDSSGQVLLKVTSSSKKVTNDYLNAVDTTDNFTLNRTLSASLPTPIY